MKIYSNGKDRELKGTFPKKFKLLDNGKEVPFLRTGKETVWLSDSIPFGELEVQELVQNKVPQKAKLDVQSLAIINKSDFDQIDLLNKKLAINQEQMNDHLLALTEQEAKLANLETQNAQNIDQTNSNIVEMAKAFGNEIQADRESLKATAKAIAHDIQDTALIINAKIEEHEKANNPHKITKKSVGLDRVDNTSDLEKPVSKATKEALDKKADKEEIEEVNKKLETADKKQNELLRNLETVNLYGGVGGNELPSGGKKGQVLVKSTNKTGDVKWVDNPVVKEHNNLTGRDAEDCHPISSITGLETALEGKQDVISDLETIRSNASAGKQASDTISTYGDIVTHDASEFATSAQGALADTALQPNDNVSSLVNDAGYITKDVNDLTNYTLTSSLGTAAFTDSSSYATSAQGALADTAVQPSTLNNYVTLNTLQTLTSGKKIFATDAVMAGNQTALLATISNNSTYTTDNAWVGRFICGAKNLTFLMGTYRTMAGIGAHSWTNAQSGSGASWADFYLNPDGDKAVYIGGNLWTKNSGWLKIKNSGNTNGTVQVNRGSISSPSWKGVACWDDNVSKFNNDAGYITSSALAGYATETWVGNQGYITGITSGDVITALGYTPYNSSNPSNFVSASYDSEKEMLVLG